MQPLFESCVFETLPPELHWQVPRDTDVLGKTLFLAGKPVALVTHRVGYRTWPCLNALPKLGRECPHCDRSRRKTVWVPVCTVVAPYQKLVIMGGEATFNSINKIPPHTLVECHLAKVIRPTKVFNRVTLNIGIKVAESVAKELHVDKGDITRWLLHYWQWPDLTRWFGEAYRLSLKNKTLRERAEAHGMEVFGLNSLSATA